MSANRRLRHETEVMGMEGRGFGGWDGAMLCRAGGERCKCWEGMRWRATLLSLSEFSTKIYERAYRLSTHISIYIVDSL